MNLLVPSYLLLASLDAARQQMAAQGNTLMEQTITLATVARSQIAEIPNLSILKPKIQPGCQYIDPTRLTINISKLGITGFEADEILDEQLGVTCELPLLHHLTFIISLGNTEDDIQQLIAACHKLTQITTIKTETVQSLSLIPYTTRAQCAKRYPLGHCSSFRTSLNPREAYFATTETIMFDQAGDRICGELICPYPPGIPLLMPGEVITTTAINYLQQILAEGGTITGCNDPTLQTIQVIK